MNLTTASAHRIHELPRSLKAEFPTVPLDRIEHDVEERLHQLIADAHFDDYVPLLVHRSVRERLRETN
jgi:hypothetical protein